MYEYDIITSKVKIYHMQTGKIMRNRKSIETHSRAREKKKHMKQILKNNNE